MINTAVYNPCIRYYKACIRWYKPCPSVLTTRYTLVYILIGYQTAKYHSYQTVVGGIANLDLDYTYFASQRFTRIDVSINYFQDIF